MRRDRMQCPQCRSENLPDAAFCQECGVKLQNVCPQCQTDNQPAAKFCRKCGASLRPSRVQPPASRVSPSQSPAAYTPPHLAERIRTEQAEMEARGATDGDGKTITALFADLKG